MKTAVQYRFCCCIIILLFILSGCENTLTDYIDSRLYTPKRLLCRSWIKTAELHYPANVIPNAFNTFLPCARDNEYRFDKDNHYELNQGGSKCYNTQEFLIEQGTWEFLQQETYLKTSLINGGRIRLYNIILLDTNYHLITSYIDSSTGTKVTVKEEFSPR